MALLDGFESFSGGLPNTLAWSLNGEASEITVSQTTSNVTEGTYTCRMQANYTFIGNSPGITVSGVDLTGASSVFLDVYVSSIGSGENVVIYVVDNDFNYAEDGTVASSTGADVLTVDLSGMTDLSSCQIVIYIATEGTADVYVDNLRDDAGGGASVGSGLITGLKLNRMSLV